MSKNIFEKEICLYCKYNNECLKNQIEKSEEDNIKIWKCNQYEKCIDI